MRCDASTESERRLDDRRLACAGCRHHDEHEGSRGKNELKLFRQDIHVLDNDDAEAEEGKVRQYEGASPCPGRVAGVQPSLVTLIATSGVTASLLAMRGGGIDGDVDALWGRGGRGKV